jgi:hypothetical protein
MQTKSQTIRDALAFIEIIHQSNGPAVFPVARYRTKPNAPTSQFKGILSTSKSTDCSIAIAS